MSTGPDDERQHPQDPAEGAREAVDEETSPTAPEPRQHPQEPAEGPPD